MAKAQSYMLPLGTKAPNFTLLNVIDDKNITFPSKQKYTASVIMFICNHCPYVKYVQHELTRMANDYLSKNIRFIAINSNDIENYPDDSPENMKRVATECAYPFPYLIDETQAVAKAYHAQCTPDFYVFDDNNLLVYRGQLDDSRPGNQHPINGSSIRAALDALINQTTIPEIQKASLGCSIKWK